MSNTTTTDTDELRAREPSLLYDAKRVDGARPTVTVSLLRAVIAHIRNGLGVRTGEWRRNLGLATRALIAGEWQYALSCIECSSARMVGAPGLAFERGKLVQCADLLREYILAERGVSPMRLPHEPRLVRD